MEDVHTRRVLGSAGVTLPELLVVLAIISMAVTVSIPLITGAVRSANGRAAANGFAVNLKAARMLAVSANAPLQVTVVAEPHPDCNCTATYYEYPARNGVPRRFDMPKGVTIASSTTPIVFRPNGSVPGGATTVIKTRVSTDTFEVWRIATGPIGVCIWV